MEGMQAFLMPAAMVCAARLGAGGAGRWQVVGMLSVLALLASPLVGALPALELTVALVVLCNAWTMIEGWRARRVRHDAQAPA